MTKLHPAITKAYVKVCRFERDSEARARRVIKALAEQISEEAVEAAEKVFEEIYEDGGEARPALHAAIVAFLKHVGEAL